MSTDVQQSISPRPFVKWAGGKGKLIQQYIPYFPKNFKTYYEPFLGGGAVFFYLNPLSAVLTDINAELVNAYHCVRDNVEELIAILEEHQRRHCRDYYYQVRQGHFTTNIEKSARLIYLNKTCYNGLYRENSKGEFNVPVGKYKNPKICNPTLLRSVSASLKNALINVRPFEDILNHANSCDDFVYFDPPYYPLSPTSNFTAYSRNSFSQDDQIRLKYVFAELAERGVKVMLSNSDCKFVRELYRDFQINSIAASRLINSNGMKRGKISEVLVTSY
jgi:DNA adenine methylase